MSEIIEEIDELEELVKDEEPEEAPDESALTFSKVAYNVGLILVDGLTGWLIWQLTFWYYGVGWILAGAVAFFLHQKNYFTAGNNPKQLSGSMRGIIVSVSSMVIMAVLAGVLFVLQIRDLAVEAGLIVIAVVLFFYHLFEFARYVFQDDGFKINNTIARSVAQANKKVKIANASGRVVGAFEKAQKTRHDQYKKHNSRAVDAAIQKMDGRKVYAAPAVPMPQVPQGAQKQQEGTSFTLADLSRVSGCSVSQIKASYANYDSFAAWCSGQFDHISSGNMKRLWYQELGKGNPPAGGQKR